MDFTFNGNISREVLNNYLSRAVTHCCLLDCDEGASATFEDDLRMLINEGAKFIGRSAYVWSKRDDAEHYRICAERAKIVHGKDPEMVLQCCVFECVHKSNCESVKIPEYVFDAFGLPYEDRCFSMEAMDFKSGRFHDHWGKDTCVPDITSAEGQMWIYYRATSYINAGCEAIHFGQVWLIGAEDKNYAMWDKIVGMVRDYAKVRARRGYVICDAHCHGILTPDGRSLFDFNSFPLRLKELEGEPEKCMLEEGYSDGIFGRSKADVPFLVEFDNFGRSKTPGEATLNSIYAWGYDEITWLANQPSEYREEFLRYAYKWIGDRYPEGHLQMPSRRCLAGKRREIKIKPDYIKKTEMLSQIPGERVKIENAESDNFIVSRLHYSANTPSEGCPYGLGDEEVIKAIWEGR